MEGNGTISDIRKGILNFFSFSIKLRDANNSYSNVNEPLLNPHEIRPEPRKQTTIWVKSQRYKKHEATGILQPLETTTSALSARL